ncbi:hypothetical protein LINPERHAP2_LOCUS14873, partial [Linum perenne]
LEGSWCIPPRRRRVDEVSSVGNSKRVGSAVVPPNNLPSSPVVTQHYSSAKRKLNFEDKGKGKLIENLKSGPTKKWVASKGIIIREPCSMDVQPLLSASDLPPRHRPNQALSDLAGPSKIGNWVVPGK